MIAETLDRLSAMVPTMTEAQKAEYRKALDRLARRGLKPHGAAVGASFDAVVNRKAD